MAPSSRDRISVDLQGLKTALYGRAKAVGVQPSALVREALADALGKPAPAGPLQMRMAWPERGAARTRLSLRMNRVQAEAVVEAARRAGLSPGHYVANLVAGIPVVTSGGRRADHVAALVTSCAGLSSLSRALQQLTLSLREGLAQPLGECPATLDTLAADVRAHLRLASTVLAELRPRGSAGDTATRTRR